jgi:iron complex transport system substrate-binding protein
MALFPKTYIRASVFPRAQFHWPSFLLVFGLSLLLMQCGEAESSKQSSEQGQAQPSPEGEAAQSQDEQEDQPSAAFAKAERIVSLDGALTETLYAAGLGERIVGVDVTSTYPPEANRVEKLGHVRQLQAEGVLALRPDLIVAKEGSMDADLQQQLQATGAEVLPVAHQASVEGAKTMIRKLTETFGAAQKGAQIIRRMEDSLAAREELATTPRVLFIYARGAGTLMVGGENTPMAEMIRLAGGRNAAAALEGFKPLTTEALVSAQPDILLLFHSGLQSLGGMSGLKDINGMAQTPAAQREAVITMDGQLLSGFGPRLGHAVLKLQRQIDKHAKPTAQR